MTVLRYIWGKAEKIKLNNDSKFAYHPLICHMIDTASVAEIFWDYIFTSQTKDWLIKGLFGNKDLTKSWLIFLAGIHDLGKATPIFQAKIPELAKNLNNYGLETFLIEEYHSILSGELFFKIFTSDEGSIMMGKKINQKLIQKFKYVIGGHHGSYPKPQNFLQLIPIYLGGKKWRKIQEILTQIILDFSRLNLTLVEKLITSEIPNLAKINSFLIFISGFISIVDWIASNENYFDFYIDFDDQKDLEQNYFKLSRLRAKNAIESIGWKNWRFLENKQSIKSFKDIFPFIKILRPLQSELMNNLEQIKSPSLTILEAPMGEGKTEAALYLEHFLELKYGLQGTYIALPTQATANQMFHRVRHFLSHAKKDLRTNLHLLHGNAVLSEEYKILKTKSKNYDEESNIVADEWFTFRKRGLIAPFGVGTIDQIMLSVLPVKYFFIRLFGLARKVIIIDEVHSYDVYMSEIIEWLIYWLKLLGSDVILLSATLPSFKREKILRIFNQDIKIIKDIPYPRLIICSKDKTFASTFNTSLKKEKDKSILIKWIDESTIDDKIQPFLKNGSKIAIICNKVLRAQNLYLKLKHLSEKKGIHLDLLHSRFPYRRRKEIEDKVIKNFGNHNTQKNSVKILISTQIIEQSLDLDFDLMISDLAPIDLLFQRMGRLHRHSFDHLGNKIIRPKELKRPQFWIFQPKLDNHNIPQFYYPIYSRYILLKTYLHLNPLATVSIPDDLELKIEEVYSENSDIPSKFIKDKEEWEKVLKESKENKFNSDLKNKLSAKYKTIPDPEDEDFFQDFSAFLDENTSSAQKSLNFLTRIISPSIQLVCLYELENNLYFDKSQQLQIDLNQIPNEEEAKEILDFTIPIANSNLFKYFMNKPKSIPDSWKKNSLIKNIHYVILSKEEKSSSYYFEVGKSKIYLKTDIGIYIKKDKINDTKNE